MRDVEFTKVYLPLVPKLYGYFYTCLKNARYQLPYDDIIKTLVSITRCQVFLNSRKESLSGWSIEALLWKKAENVWYEYFHRRPSRFTGIDTLRYEASNESDPLYQLLNKERIQILKAKIAPDVWEIIEMRAEGMTYGAIADSLDRKEGAVKMQLHRALKDLEVELARL